MAARYGKSSDRMEGGGVEFVIDRSPLVFNLCPRARGI